MVKPNFTVRHAMLMISFARLDKTLPSLFYNEIVIDSRSNICWYVSQIMQRPLFLGTESGNKIVFAVKHHKTQTLYL